MCDTKIGRPKKIAGNLSDPKNSGNFARPRKIAKKICQPRKIGFGQISNPKNRTSIPVKILTCAPGSLLCHLFCEPMRKHVKHGCVKRQTIGNAASEFQNWN